MEFELAKNVLYYLTIILVALLGTFAKLRLATIYLRHISLFVRPSVCSRETPWLRME